MNTWVHSLNLCTIHPWIWVHAYHFRHDIRCFTADKQGNITPLRLCQVLYAPSLQMTLFSVPAACVFLCDYRFLEQIFITPSGIEIPFEYEEGLYVIHAVPRRENAEQHIEVITKRDPDTRMLTHQITETYHELPESSANQVTKRQKSGANRSAKSATATAMQTLEPEPPVKSLLTFTEEQILTEHERYGHMHFKTLQRKIGFNWQGPFPHCHWCDISKHIIYLNIRNEFQRNGIYLKQSQLYYLQLSH